MEGADDQVAAIIVAGGVGARARQPEWAELPKQYQLLAGKPVIHHTLKAFLDCPEVNLIITVIADGMENEYRKAVNGITDSRLLPPVTGGATRQQSVHNGLAALAALAELNISNVLVHDAARPFANAQVIRDVLASLQEHDAVISAVPETSTLKKVNADSGLIEDTVNRESIWQAQTPQGFRFSEILALHQKYAALELTDDAALFEQDGRPVAVSKGHVQNIKITHPEDFDLAESYMRISDNFEFRTGQGFDVHRFEDGDSVTLCGVSIPHDRKLKGHSDADVAMHALTDAILGAICEGDIGFHFPPSEPQWKGAPSNVFLEKARDLASDKNGLITHCDITIICEKPKVNPHREAMRARLAEILRCDVQRVSVKATTTEKLGFTGREEGISALATATVRLPAETDT